MSGQKRVFWEALVLSIFVFSIGVALGYFIESVRVDKISEIYTNSELALLDSKLQSQIYELKGISCEAAQRKTIEFADRIYEEARMLDRYEEAQRLSETLIFEHKRYDLLRMSLWLNSIKIKEECNSTFHTLVYFYKYQDPSIDTKAMQGVYSKVLGEVKEELGSEVILIPIAADLQIESIELIMELYKVEDLPSILIDEKIIKSGSITKEEIISSIRQ
jgi:hypothetical protein